MADDLLNEQVREAQAGQPEALEQVVRTLERPMYRLALRMLGHPDRAADATQEILILIVTQLGSFRGESSVKTWAYRVAVRYLVRHRKRTGRERFEVLAEEHLGQPPNAIEPSTLARAEAKLLEEEVFVGCTQVMLLALSPAQRAVFVLGYLCDLDAKQAAAVLGTNEVAFRKRLSRARSVLDSFVSAQCGVANADNPCRCRHQINHNVARGVLVPERLCFARAELPRSLEALSALHEIARVRSALELYRAQPELHPPKRVSEGIRRALARSQFFAST